MKITESKSNNFAFGDFFDQPQNLAFITGITHRMGDNRYNDSMKLNWNHLDLTKGGKSDEDCRIWG